MCCTWMLSSYVPLRGIWRRRLMVVATLLRLHKSLGAMRPL